MEERVLLKKEYHDHSGRHGSCRYWKGIYLCSLV